MGMPAAKRVTTVGQLLAAQSAANAKRTPAVLAATGQLATHPSNPKSISYAPRQRYNPVTVVPTMTPSVAATVTLQSSPQPIATTRPVPTNVLPSEPNRHYLDPSAT
ncbi:unnamed protein product [Toxocara canis]|nr:unnamed protein product [Toxocara canis]